MARSSCLVGIMGSDTEGSLSAELYEREAHRHDLRYLCRCVDADGQAFRGKGIPELLRVCRDFGFSGLRVTPPYRHTVVPHLDELSEHAVRLGAVDLVVFTMDGRTVGHNTDAAGRVAALARGLPGVPCARVVQMGAGAAGTAAAHALLEQKTEHLLVTDPDPGRARALVEQLNRQSPVPDWAETFPAEKLAAQLEGADGLVAALPSSGTEERDASMSEALHKNLWIFDAHRDLADSSLLWAGRALGCQVLDAGAVLVNEAAEAFRLVTGLTPHTSHMLGDFADMRAEPRVHT
ncbi:shikimate dehydrogenase [Streptomyces sp. NPDC006285]|uniref:shikimate dehydrogenase n=1 Tax=Streptomyces sp. NPDC006285 TaxID=3364742 RepID=UPI003697140F